MLNTHIYCVILAGGSGERLWPLSRQKNPKQLLEIENDQTLLEQAVKRVELLIPNSNIFISTTQQYKRTILDIFGNRIGGVIVEPAMRNTGPSILLSCIHIYKNNPQAIVTFVPADPFIPTKDNNKFAQCLEHAINFSSQSNSITLLGVKPTFAATQYGYIEYDTSSISQPSSVKKFHEKPSAIIAEHYLNLPSMLWNIGMFCAKASVFIQEYEKWAPDIYQETMNYLSGSANYESIKSDSIDHAIIEKSDQVSVLPVDFAWCDVGSLATFLTIKNMLNSSNDSQILQTDSHNNLVSAPNTLVVLIGVSDLCIVQTDQVLLITKRQDDQKIREIMQQVKTNGLTQYL